MVTQPNTNNSHFYRVSVKKVSTGKGFDI